MSIRLSVLLLLLVSLLTILGCGGGSTEDTVRAAYEELPVPDTSSINIPVTIEVEQLEALINSQLDTLTFGNSQEEDRLQVKVKKEGEIKLEIFSDRIRYLVPLDLDIEYDLSLTTAKADGILELDFVSRFRIDSSWNVVTETDMVSHRWNREPKLRLGLVSLPLSSISDYAIRRSETMIEENIDLAVAQELRLAEYITEAWNQLQRPVEVAPEYQAWLQVQPQDLRMSPLRATEKSISADITLFALPRIVFSMDAPAALPTPFPRFRYTDEYRPENNFQLKVGTLVTYEEAQRLASESVVGETFSSGNRSVTVNDLQLFGRNGELIVELAATGAYNGNIYLSGIPEYDTRRNKLEIRDLDFTLQTKSFLTKTAAWLFKSKLKNQIVDNFDAMVTENLAEMRDQIETQLEEQEVTEGISLRGGLNDLSLGNTYLTPEGIEITVSLSGDLQLDLSGFGKIGEE